MPPQPPACPCSAPSSPQPAPEGPRPRRPHEGGRDAGPPRQDPVSPGSTAAIVGRAPRHGHCHVFPHRARARGPARPPLRQLHRLPPLSAAPGSPPGPVPPPLPLRAWLSRGPAAPKGHEGRGSGAGALGGSSRREGAAGRQRPRASPAPPAASAQPGQSPSPPLPPPRPSLLLPDAVRRAPGAPVDECHCPLNTRVHKLIFK